ncbi:hypothetical protein L839_0004 [Mycobacterium avium MAV_120809_2495]|nr:hypothetical protein L839_0004 [Mycobacterium avium MAV_120809_2495]
MLKAGELDKALDVVDRRVLIDALASAPAVADCRAAWRVCGSPETAASR